MAKRLVKKRADRNRKNGSDAETCAETVAEIGAEMRQRVKMTHGLLLYVSIWCQFGKVRYKNGADADGFADKNAIAE